MKQKGQSKIVFFLTLTFLMVLMINPTSFGTGQEYNAPYRAGNGPVIDGTITGTEWTHSTVYNITFGYNGTENQLIQVSVYLLHNGSALFIGLNITQGALHMEPKDTFSIYFDEYTQHILSGNATHPKEEGANLTRAGDFTDLSFNGTAWINDLSIVNLTKGPSTGATNGVGMWEFIFVSSYNDVTRQATNGSDFDVNLPSNVMDPAVTIGFDIEYYDANLSQTDSFVTSINGTEALNPSQWDHLTFGRVPFNEPDYLAIWAFIILVMIVPTVLVVYLLIWIIRRKIE